MTTVINHRQRQVPNSSTLVNPYVFIGRPSKWGNPHPVGRTCPLCGFTHSQGHAIVSFRQWWLAEGQRSLRAEALVELKDKVLGCPGGLCTPDFCHGKVIADYVNQYAQ